jgi:triacylglycerol lipase
MAMELSPIQAAEIADSTYQVRLSSNMRFAEAAAPTAREAFDIGGGTHVVGSTGMGVIEQQTGFGYVAWGKAARQGECLVTVRGTHPKSGYDWLSNVRMGGIIGPSGYIVHTGFWRAAQSVLPQILQQLRGRNPSALHIVGHSLGGAMATLIADSLSGIGCGVRLYTFGAPRSGLEGHAEYLSGRLGEQNIYRCYHDTDPVPMVPIFPYFHVPYGSNAYRLKGPGKLVSIEAHSMPDAYEKTVAGCSWSSLPVILPKHSSFEKASEWLADAAKDSGPFIMRSAAALQLILSALDWIVKQVSNTPRNVLGVGLFAGTTVLDTLARLLYSGVLQSIRLGEAVRNLMSAVMRFMGRVVASTVQMTVGFIEYVLGLLFRFLSAIARRALDMFS